MYCSLALFATLLAVHAAAIGDADPYLWLEDVTGEKALGWVKKRNAESTAELTKGPEFQALNDRLLKILDSKEKIPYIAKRGEFYYNFWRDEKNKRGLWRRTTLEEYRKASRSGRRCSTSTRSPRPRRRTGSGTVRLAGTELRPVPDAPLARRRGRRRRPRVRPEDEGVREGRLRAARGQERRGLEGSRHAPRRHRLRAGSLTDSGYPRVVKEWKRGTKLADAALVFEGEKADVAVAAMNDMTKGFERDFVHRAITFWESELFLRATASW